ncbi:AIR synthase-related protein [Polyangium sp. y55x31]|uniref:AIR synthase-related protein n=1 Tax=Polyangium sp. y55x31 TaxID=3042688 RepID=UPI0024832114|nr:AIR synthase-related protein [Polyangium sp. y55x31]MDI1480476.1 AIR synthase-related protein [Polyangium sp. y55x31]
MPIYRLEIENRPAVPDALATKTAQTLSAWLGLSPARIRTRKVYLCDLDMSEAEAKKVLAAIADPVIEVAALGALPDGEPGDPPVILTVSFLPGVTDAVGKSVKTACEDALGRALAGQVYTGTMYLVWGLPRADVERAAAEVLHNPLIQRIRIDAPPRRPDLSVPRAGATQAPRTEIVPLRGLSDEALERLSRERLLALSVPEMHAARDHFEKEGREPTDAELECIAQTWSEHCKHKIFNAPIEYTDPAGNTRRIERGVFKTYVVAATEDVRKARASSGIDGDGGDFLVSVFSDNAGVVRFTDECHLVYKVETHNSPSALDPYGGAMTGIVGVNRDSFGCGLGADLLANVWGYCLGKPNHTGALPKGLMPPRRIRDGVHHGVIDGGNQSGIPYMRGFELFDDRFTGKPLVYCGTVAAMPVETAGRPTHEKFTAPGDRIVMIGGRVGKDGIHGATFSSVELNESSPVQAVQIGDPITQKMMFDMLAEARDRGLYSGITDNGAGGLSSSVGEMAEASGGAEIDLARVPLKYPGLAPWEILVSEAQERMTVAVPPDKLEAFLALAARREVEATEIGTFTNSGKLVVRYGEEKVCDLSLAFLHGGLPKVVRTARWSPPPRAFASAADRDEALAARPLGDLVVSMLAQPNIRSGERYARHYDHEVKGLAVVKPFVGVFRDVPATATVMRVRHGRDEGVVLGEGIHPHWSDIDTHAMALACADEGVRRILCAGARIDRMAALDNFCWPDPIKSTTTPDGEHKLAQLVRACEGLYEACVAYGLPLISGKDSMKNDATLGGVKISVPPTLLVSVIGQMKDVRCALTLSPRAPGDVVYLLGETEDACGESELSRLLGLALEGVPRTDAKRFAARYHAFAAAHEAGLVRSAHVLSRGGLAVALSHMVMASELGLSVSLDGVGAGLSPAIALFSESTGRILLSTRAEDAAALEARLSPHALVRLGTVEPGSSGRGYLRIRQGGQTLAEIGSDALRRAFQEESHAV